MNAKELTVLMVEPGKHPEVTKIKDDLDSLQKAVSIGADYQGLIEFVTLGNGDCIMCNEEGKLIAMKETLQTINAAWTDFDDVQQAAVKALCDQYAVTQTWELTNIFPTEE